MLLVCVCARARVPLLSVYICDIVHVSSRMAPVFKVIQTAMVVCLVVVTIFFVV